MRVEARRVGLLTRRAHAAGVSAPDGPCIVPIFGPNGLLILMPGPLPRSETDFDTRDVAQVCGTRRPEADTDFAARRREWRPNATSSA